MEINRATEKSEEEVKRLVLERFHK